MTDMATLFLAVIALLAVLIILGTIIAVIVILRKPESGKKSNGGPQPVPDFLSEPISDEDLLEGTQTVKLPTPVPSEDMEDYLMDQQANLADFELKDLSTSFKGSTGDGQRQGVVLHLTQSDTPLISFTSQIYNSQSGAISADTIYGKMELIIAQGRAGIQWEGSPLGILDYGKQRILGPEGQLLGSMERPVEDGLSGAEIGSYPIAFYGKKAAEVNTVVNALSTLRWFGGDEADPQPAFSDLADELEDEQTLILVGALLLEIAFFDAL